MNRAQAIYIDTNILIRLNYGDASVDFFELRGLLEGNSVSMYVPETVVKEFIQYRIRDAQSQVDKIKTASTKLARLLGRSPSAFETPNDLTETIKGMVNEFIQAVGLEIIKTPDISLETLIDMAVQKEPPFEEKGEKGFRDSVIVFTIIDHMKNNDFSTAIFVSNDKIFSNTQVIKRFQESGLMVLVEEGFTQAKEQFNKQINKVTVKFLEKFSKEILPFLRSRSQEIFEYVLKNAEVSEDFLKRRGLLRQEELLSGTIRKVLAVRPVEISGVFPAHLSKKQEEAEEGYKPVTLFVETEFDLVIEEYGFLPTSSPKFKLSAPEDFEKLPRTFSLGPTVREITITRPITVETWVSKQNDEYSNIKLLRIMSY